MAFKQKCHHPLLFWLLPWFCPLPSLKFAIVIRHFFSTVNEEDRGVFIIVGSFPPPSFYWSWSPPLHLKQYQTHISTTTKSNIKENIIYLLRFFVHDVITLIFLLLVVNYPPYPTHPTNTSFPPPWMVTCSGIYCCPLCILPTPLIPILILNPIVILWSSQITTQWMHEGGIYSIYFLWLCCCFRRHPNLIDLPTSPSCRVGSTFTCHHHLCWPPPPNKYLPPPPPASSSYHPYWLSSYITPPPSLYCRGNIEGRTKWFNRENISRNTKEIFLQWRAAMQNGMAQTWRFPC